MDIAHANENRKVDNIRTVDTNKDEETNNLGISIKNV